MRTQVTTDAVIAAVGEELATVWGAKLGGIAELAPAETAGEAGWMVTMTVGGSARGRLAVWFEREGTIACARVALGLEEGHGEDVVMGMARESVVQAANAIAKRPGNGSLVFAESRIAPEACPMGATGYQVTVEGKPSCTIAVAAEMTVAAPPPLTGNKLEAVLDVDLPLTVRFGRAVMPLRTLAGLAPGSVVDMGRSPDEPVELLVGERLIARGEVVVVGGNYGVRITELTNSRHSAAELEARTS